MKNRIIVWVIAFFALVLLPPCGLWAETPPPCPFDTPQAKKVWANAPQTPEALLRVLKEFMDNPQMNGFEFGEKISGIARGKWGAPYTAFSGEYFPFKNLEPPSRYVNGKFVPNWERPVPYYFGDSTIDLDKNGELEQVTLLGFKKNFCLTPALIREILGEPIEISLDDKGGLSVDYKKSYEQRQYKIVIACSPKQAIKTINKIINTTTDNEEFPRIFEERKNSCAIRVSIIRTK